MMPQQVDTQPACIVIVFINKRNMVLLRRCFCTKNALQPFSEIPGPKSLPIIGTLWSYLPIIGPYRFDLLHKNGALKLRKYGPVVKEEIVPGQTVVWIFEPEDVQELLRKEGRFPERRSHLAIQHLRLKNPDKYNTGGLLPTNGPEWWRLRSAFQKGLSSPRDVRTYIPQVNAVIDEFLEYVEKTHDPADPTDFLQDLSRLFLELLGVITFGVRFNSFSSAELKKHSLTTRLIDAALDANSCILRTDNGPQLWKHFPTPLYRRLRRAHGYMEKVALELINKMKAEMTKATDPSCLLAGYMMSSELDSKDVLGMAVDIFLAGVDTTTYTSSFALYHLSRHPATQKELLEESISVMKGQEITSDLLGRFHYVKAVLKETLRLNPVSVGVGRLLAEDAVFSGFIVPKKTVVVTQSQVICRQEKFFHCADEFKPERWLKGGEKYESVSPYLLLPFGHGSRTCIARRLAEQNIQLLLTKIIQKFSLEWAGADLDVKSLLINKPDGPILLKLKPRKSET